MSEPSTGERGQGVLATPATVGDQAVIETACDTGDPGSAIGGRAVRVGDRVFSGLSRGASVLLLLVIAGIAAFLFSRTIPAIQADKANFLTEQSWFPDTDGVFGIAALAWGTVLSSAVALLLAIPVAIGIALFIAHYAPRRLASGLGYLVDLLAAVPSVIYGLWGLTFLVPQMVGLTRFLAEHLAWIPLFATPDSQAYRQTMFNAAVVLAVMVLPIITAVSREVFLQVPRAHLEAALALGATRWEMVRMAVLPFGRSGVISASMLGLGRALGETVAVALVLSTTYKISLHILQPGGNTFAANIALQYSYAQSTGIDALIASGMVLFVITLLVNMAARWIIARRAEFSGAR
ncbi:MAG TPA: phosphate ABC transporter permease subunit PstC [Kineosporiaceae bacterium]|nr:phosphate ABC transporter permease subunit PstC [Kineosporiaceae bacterium]